MAVAETSRGTWLLRWPGRLLWGVVTVLGSAVAALLVSRDRWLVLLILLAAVPAFLAIQRYPLGVMGLWFLVMPFMSGLEDGGRLKMMYWVIHRMLPVATLAVLLLSYVTRTGYRRLGRLGWAEVFMLAYLVASVLSVLFFSNSAGAELRHLYDRVAVPMILYLLVRLLRPGSASLKKLSYILVFVVLSQAAAGLVSWVAPGLLPARFLGRVGERTTGTLDHANVFAIVVLAAGAVFFHVGRNVEGWRRRAATPVFLLAVALAILSFSRASWLAALAVVAGVAFAYPRFVARASAVAAVGVVVFMVAGGSQALVGYLDERLYSEASERSALSRLPVVYASVRMIEERPLTGWGFGNFDLYDIQFQSRVGELFVPEKDHASHNLFLTIGAEQGLIGLVTYLGAAAYWLIRTPRAMARLRSPSLLDRRLMIILWSVLAGHVIVNNFSNMKVSFGLAVWWLSLALIGNMVTEAQPRERAPS